MFSQENPSLASCSGDNFLEVIPKVTGSVLNIVEETYPFDLSKPFELNANEGKEVFPTPGYCIKSKTDKDEKVFINICHCEDVPKPDEKLMELKNADGDDPIRFPLGFGSPRTEKDRSGKDCICFDVVLNSEFFDRLLKDEDTRSLVMYLCIQGIADKYGISIRDDCCLKLTKPYHGSVQKHFVKNTESRGLDNLLSALKDTIGSETSLTGLMKSSSLEDSNSSDDSSCQSVLLKKGELLKGDKSGMIQSLPSVIPDPPTTKLPKKQKSTVRYGLFITRTDIGYPNQYVLEVCPAYCSADSRPKMKVFVSVNRVVVTEKDRNLNIDVSLPNPVIPERCQANFHDGTLAVVLPMAPYHEGGGDNEL